MLLCFFSAFAAWYQRFGSGHPSRGDDSRCVVNVHPRYSPFFNESCHLLVACVAHARWYRPIHPGHVPGLASHEQKGRAVGHVHDLQWRWLNRNSQIDTFCGAEDKSTRTCTPASTWTCVLAHLEDETLAPTRKIVAEYNETWPN